MKSKTLIAIIFFSVVLTTLGINASDSLSTRSGSLLGQLMGADKALCPAGMVEVPMALSFTCVDQYEASTNENCPYQDVKSSLDTKDNFANKDCSAVSSKDKKPWVYISREEASLACVRAGKRLPDAREWYLVSMGTVKDACNIDSLASSGAGSNNACESAVHVFDAVGNVWEWVSDDVQDGVYNGRVLPESGYVSAVDQSGVATSVSSSSVEDDLFGGYFWSNNQGVFAMIRGGYYGSKSDAGIYSLKAETLATFSGQAVGFRCVK